MRYDIYMYIYVIRRLKVKMDHKKRDRMEGGGLDSSGLRILTGGGL